VTDRISHVPPQPDADLMLMSRLAARDERALGELYDRHNRLVFGVIFRILGQRDEAEDVLQEVFLTVWTKAAAYNAALGSPAGWLIGIARNRALDRLRATAVRSRTVEAAAADVPPPATTPEYQAASSEQQRTVGMALDLLPADQRMLIEEAYFLGLTHSELADRHRLPLGTVKTRIRAGMLALRQHLSPSYAEQ
jgi:RNA polymerase sigma-70 factor, ECF subfamily